MKQISWKNKILWLYRTAITMYLTAGSVMIWGSGWREILLLICLNIIMVTFILADLSALQQRQSYVKICWGGVATFAVTAIVFFTFQHRMEPYVYVMVNFFFCPVYAAYAGIGMWLAFLLSKRTINKKYEYMEISTSPNPYPVRRPGRINFKDKKLWLWRLVCWVILIVYQTGIIWVYDELSFYYIWPFLIISIYFLRDRESLYNPQTWTYLYRAAWISYIITALIQYCFPAFLYTRDSENVAWAIIIWSSPLYMLYSWLAMEALKRFFMKKSSGIKI